MSCNGKIIPHTPLAVDFWHVRKCPGSRLFFLSHMHSDHTVGLTSTWSNWPIYCSPITATLLQLKLQVKEEWIHPLELGDPYRLPMDDIGKETLTVTLIDANHCPGSVMFLFEGYFGSILYTGDFRYTPSMLREPCLRTNITIDVLYLDNTNCDPNRSLPTRQRASQQIKEIIRSHPNHSVVIGMYALGKESLLVELAMEFKTWVHVSTERMETLKALELPDVFSTDPGAYRIRAVAQSEICSSAFLAWNKEEPTLAIIPTSRPMISFHPKVFIVPYSDHSSYRELEDFVSAIKPTSLVPIVGNCLPGSLSSLLPRKRRHEIFVPESVRHYMLRQPERTLGSLAYNGLHRRPFRTLLPRGVVFDSPGKSSEKSCEEVSEAESMEQDSEEDMDTEQNENDSDCLFVDQSIKHNPKSSTGGAGDVWTGYHVQTVSEDLAMAESAKIQRSYTTSLKPIRQSRSLKSAAKVTDGEWKECLNTIQHGRSDHNKGLLQISPDRTSCTSSPASTLSREFLETLEEELLKCLPFSEEDFKIMPRVPQMFVKKFSLSPLKDSDEKENG